MQRTLTALLFLTSLLVNPLWVSADEHVHFEPDPGFIQLPETIKLGSCSVRTSRGELTAENHQSSVGAKKTSLLRFRLYKVL